ncbi:hypothetical protein QQP08_013118 [Theobroma cacao]|nr:hypothetical protein QQP08_013118 [Theobroma cacao]
MFCESAKETGDKVKKDFQGSDKTRNMQVLNFMRQFEVLKMKPDETMKDYVDKLMKIVNQALGISLPSPILPNKMEHVNGRIG